MSWFKKNKHVCPTIATEKEVVVIKEKTQTLPKTGLYYYNKETNTIVSAGETLITLTGNSFKQEINVEKGYDQIRVEDKRDLSEVKETFEVFSDNKYPREYDAEHFNWEETPDGGLEIISLNDGVGGIYREDQWTKVEPKHEPHGITIYNRKYDMLGRGQNAYYVSHDTNIEL